MERKIIRRIEEQVTRELLLTANDAGWPCIGFNFGDGFERQTDYEQIVETCLNVDEILLIFESPDKTRRASVFLVYGNDGFDLVNDYSITEGFDAVMDKINDYTDNIEKKLFS